MTIARTYVKSRKQVDAIATNSQRSIVDGDDNPPDIGCLVRIVSSETEVTDRRDVLRITTDVFIGDGGWVLISLRPLQAHEKQALRKGG